MSLINAANTPLDGQVGDGSFVGDNGPTFSGLIDYGDANTLKIPNLSSPVLSQNGQIAIDTGIPGHTGSITYHSGGSQQYIPNLTSLNMVCADGYIPIYSADSGKFIMSAHPAGGGDIINYSYALNSTATSTTSTSFIDTSLSTSIVPLSASSSLWVKVFLDSYIFGSVVTGIFGGEYVIRRTSGVAADLTLSPVGTNDYLPLDESIELTTPLNMQAWEVAGDTLQHDYIVRIRANINTVTTQLRTSFFDSLIVVYEVSA